MGGKLKSPEFAQKLQGPVRDAFFGPDWTRNSEFAAAHPDSAPPAKRQSYDSFTKAYGDAHPVKAEPAQGLPAPSASSASTPATPATPQAQQPTTYSAPQGMMNASAPKAPGAPGAAAAPVSPAATPQSPAVSPQAAQLPQGAIAARAANQMAGANQQKQFQLPSVGQISFGGS